MSYSIRYIVSKFKQIYINTKLNLSFPNIKSIDGLFYIFYFYVESIISNSSSDFQIEQLKSSNCIFATVEILQCVNFLHLYFLICAIKVRGFTVKSCHIKLVLVEKFRLDC